MNNTFVDNKVLDLGGRKVPSWLARPSQLVSLLDMITFKAHDFFRLTQFMKAIELIVEKDKTENTAVKINEAS
jgi:hypothetical protein